MKSIKWRYVLIGMLCMLFGLGVGLVSDWGIGFHVSPIPHDFDTTAVLESALAFAIGTITLVGAVILVTTWNDIDKRSEEIVSKYETQAKQSINAYGDKREEMFSHAAKESQEGWHHMVNRDRRIMFWQGNIVVVLMVLALAYFSSKDYLINKKLKGVSK